MTLVFLKNFIVTSVQNVNTTLIVRCKPFYRVIRLNDVHITIGNQQSIISYILNWYELSLG